MGDVLARAFSIAIFVHYRNHVKSEKGEMIPNASSVFIEQHYELQ